MTSFKKAWDNFAGSDEYHEAIDPTTLPTFGQPQKYLENRIARAFAAGWNAAMIDRRFAGTSKGETGA